MICNYRVNNAPGTGSITINGGTELFRNSHHGAGQIEVVYSLIKMPKNASVTILSNGSAGVNYTGRSAIYYAFKFD